MAGIPSPPIGAVFDSDTLPGTKMYVFDLTCLKITPIKEINVIPITVSPFSETMYTIRSHFDIPFILNKSNNFISNFKVPANDVNKCIFEIDNYSDDGQRLYRTILQLALNQINKTLTKPIRNNVSNETSNSISQFKFKFLTYIKGRIQNVLTNRRLLKDASTKNGIPIEVIPIELYDSILNSWNNPRRNLSPSKAIRANAVAAAASFPPLPPPSRVTVPLTWANSHPSIQSILATAKQNKEKYTTVPTIMELYIRLNTAEKDINVDHIIEIAAAIESQKEKVFSNVQPIIKNAKQNQEKYTTVPAITALYERLNRAIEQKHIDAIKAIARDIAAQKENVIYIETIHKALENRDKYDTNSNPGLKRLYGDLDYYSNFGYYGYNRPRIYAIAKSIVEAKKNKCNESSCTIAGGTRRRHKKRKAKSTRRRI